MSVIVEPEYRLEPEDVTVREVPGVMAGIRVVNVRFSREFKENVTADLERPNGDLVLQLYIMTRDLAPFHVLAIVSEDIDIEADGFGDILTRLRNTYGLQDRMMRWTFVLNARIEDHPNGIGPVSDEDD